FPAGNYNVYAGLSHGDAPNSGTLMSAALQRVTSDPAQPNQTVADLGTFSAPATGGWGNNALVPMKDTGGNLVSLNLSGATTLRMVPTNGDYDFILFTPATTLIQFNPTAIAGNGDVTLSWVGSGRLQQASALTGSPSDWSDVNPQPGGNTVTITGPTA